MVDEDTVKFQLNFIFPRGRIVTDSIENETVNSAIVVASHIRVLDTSVKEDGSMSWVTVDSPLGCFLYVHAEEQQNKILEVGGAKKSG